MLVKLLMENFINHAHQQPQAQVLSGKVRDWIHSINHSQHVFIGWRTDSPCLSMLVSWLDTA